MAAAKALARHTDARRPGRSRKKSMRIAASICIYSNDTITIETL